MIESLAKSGFKELTAADVLPTDNIRPCVNEYSAFARVADAQLPTDAPLIVDSFYGQLYDQMPLDARAIYGPTDELPAYDIDRLSNHGFLRVPFRRIPRRVVHSPQELLKVLEPLILTLYKRGVVYFRGQTQEYVLPRTDDVRRWLYGDAQAVEPSLRPSVTRSTVDLRQIVPLWNGVVAQYLEQAEEKARREKEEEILKSLAEDEQIIGLTYQFHHFAIALAQHYGFATSGLDLTPDVATALFFAFHKFRKVEGGFRAERVAYGENLPVLYALFPPKENINAYSSYGPRAFRINRPRAQQAVFAHTGWGHSLNDGARRILFALYLDFDPEDVNLPSPAELFPSPLEDEFGVYLEEVMKRPIPVALADYVKGFSWVVDG